MPKGKKIQINDNMSTADRVVLCAGELVATAILVFLGCMGCTKHIYITDSIPHEQVSLTFGLAVMVAVQVFGHVCGSHINPSVTLTAATLGNISLIQVPIYFVGQFLGALGGFGLLKIVTPDNIWRNENDTLGLCSPGLHPDVSAAQGFLIEFTITFILGLVCCGVWDSRNSDKHDSTSIRFGLSICVLALAAGPYTGAHMNPVRSFAPALFNGDWKHHWIYWVAPLSGAFLSGLLYRFVFTKDPPPPRSEIAEGIPLNEHNKA